MSDQDRISPYNINTILYEAEKFKETQEEHQLEDS